MYEMLCSEGNRHLIDKRVPPQSGYVSIKSEQQRINIKRKLIYLYFRKRDPD